MNIKAYLQTLSDREGVLLVVAVATTVLGAVFLAITEPMTIERDRRLNQLADARATVQYVEAQSGRAAELRALQSGRREFTDGESLIGVVDRSLNQAGLNQNVRRVTPNGAMRAAIVFDDVSVDELLRWLIELHEGAGISVMQISVNPVKERGRANVSVELTTT